MISKTTILLFGFSVAACGGSTVIDPGGQGGASSSSNQNATTTSNTTSSVATGPAGCSDHRDCGEGNVCIFSTGRCARSCQNDGCASCDAGSVCDGCATSSCPACADCRAACVPIEPGQCDDDDPCGEGTLCLFDRNLCAPPCTPNGGCSDPSLTCVDCITGSCCGCDDCVAACVTADF
jgi:hypothetical protein